VDGLLGKEAKTVIKVIAQISAKKAGMSYSQYCGFIRARLNMAII
jgi:hypothetical protein